MIPYSLLPLAAFSVNGVIFTYLVAQQHHRDKVNRVFLFICSFLSLWAFIDFLLWAGAISDSWVLPTARIQTFFWMMLGPFFVDFIYKYTGRHPDGYLYFSYGSALIFILVAFTTPLMVCGYTRTYWGVRQYFGPLILPFVVFGYLLPYGRAVLIGWRTMRTESDQTRKKQLGLIIAGTALTLGFGLVVNIFLGHVFGKPVIQLASTSSIILTPFILRAVLQYNFLRVGAEKVEQVFNHLFANIREAVLITDRNGEVVQANKVAQELFSIPEGTQQHFDVRAVVRDYDEMPGAWCREIELHRDGGGMHLLLTQSELEAAGPDRGRILLFRDITGTKQSERALKEHEEYIRTIMDSVQVGIIIVDEGTHTVFNLNPAAEQLLGRSRSAVLGQPCHNYICPHQPGFCPITDQEWAATSSECTLTRKNGEVLDIFKTVVPVTIKGRNYIVESLMDISAQKATEKELRESEQTISEQNRHSQLRAEIWQLASRKELTEEQLIQRLLDTIAPVFGVSRACYNKVLDNRIECVTEWCKPGVAASLHTSLPYKVARSLLDKPGFTEVTPDTILGKIPKMIRPVARPVIEALTKQLDVVSIGFVSCVIDGQLEGGLSFDICAGEIDPPVWTEEKKAIVTDLVQIITQTITRKRMEGAIREAQEGLEQRVAERTTELQDANLRLGASLEEKEVLLKEIHHRVKNNLQIVSSLLNLQSRHIQDPAARSIFQDSQSRVRSMALIHEKLYRSADLANVDFAGYVRKLGSDLFFMYESHGHVDLNVEIGKVPLSVNQAIPCGLIINELVSNALKYAFPEGRKGTVTIRMERTPDGLVRLTVADDGVGLPADIGFDTSESLGLQLVKTLSDQLDGTAGISRDNGTTFTITFKSQ